MSATVVMNEQNTVATENQTKFFDYEYALQQSIEYFNGDKLAAKVFLDKYALRDNDQQLLEATPEHMHWRIANEFARVEKKKFKNPYSANFIFSLLDKFKRIVPQGSPMYGLGNNFQIISLSNCYVLQSPVDSYGGIHRADEQLSQISKRRGGVGLDISHLRPNGSTTHNAARTSTGILSFMDRFSNSIREVGQAGRRGALMITISCHHPEVMDFASVKKDLTKVTGANISVRLSDEFLKAVEEDTDYELRWPCDTRKNGQEPKFSKMVSAREVWKKIVENAHAMAEPGLLFWDNILRESPPDCYSDLGFETICTNPCSEIPLSALDSCRLLLLNLLGYVRNPWTKDAVFDFDAFHKDSQIAQRLMDDLIDLEIEKIEAIIGKVEADPEDEDVKRVELNLWRGVRDACIKGRRTGTGITALGDALAACGIKYGSTESVAFTDEVYRTLKLGCYRSSVDMAKEIGAFPIYDYSREIDCPFIQRIAQEDPDLYADMVKYGRRNIALLTTAPAGSVSLLTQTTSGIEPLFQMYFIRRKKITHDHANTSRVDFTDANGDKWQEFKVFHPRIADWAKANGNNVEEINEELLATSPWAGCCAEELDWKFRVELQAAANKHVDHAISSTINLPEDVTVEQVANIYVSAWKMGCKGITVYRKNCRTGVLIDDKSKLKKPEQTARIVKTNAPKRPEKLPAEVHHISVKGEQYFVFVGLMDGEPYEVFAGKNGFIPKSVKTAVVKKMKRGHYQATLDNDQVVENIADHIEDDQEALTRAISWGLRHGGNVEYGVHQFEKTKGDLYSFSKAVARALKKHIPEGAKVTGETCPSCNGSNLQRRDGCATCVDCGHSKCA